MTTRIVRVSAVVVVLLAAGACASAPSKQSSSPPPATSKLVLTQAGGARSGAADARAPLPLARPTTYVLDGTLPDLGAHAPVYRWTAHDVDIAAVNDLAAAFGISAPATTTGDGFQATDGSATLTVTISDGTAEVSYFLGGPGTIDGSSGGSGSGSSGASSGSVATGSATPPANSAAVASPPPEGGPVTSGTGTTISLPRRLAPVDVPSAHEAESIARSLLDRAGVLAGQQWDTDVNDSGGIAISCTVGQECTDTPGAVSARDVTFQLVVDGARVEGIDWNVTVGAHSRIESVSGEWASAVEIGSYDLRTTASAFTALQKDDAYFAGVEPVAGEVPVRAQDAPASSSTIPRVDVHVTGVSLGVARWDAVDGDHDVVDLVPTYLFHTSGPDSASADVDVLALAPTAIDFAPPIALPLPAPAPTPEPSTSR